MPGARGCPDYPHWLPPANYKFGAPVIPFQIWWFARVTHRMWKTLFLTLIIKDESQGQPNGRDAKEKASWGRSKSFHVLSDCATFPNISMYLPTQKLSKSFCSSTFITQFQVPLSSSKIRGIEMKVPTLKSLVWSSWWPVPNWSYLGHPFPLLSQQVFQ